jgi:hypothetical protein
VWDELWGETSFFYLRILRIGRFYLKKNRKLNPKFSAKRKQVF